MLTRRSPHSPSPAWATRAPWHTLVIVSAGAVAVAVALLALAALPACSDNGDGPDVPLPDIPPPTATEGVDLLFVVDNSGSMNEEQLSLRDSVPGFLSALETAYGRLPDMHIGVISTDMGAGPNNEGTGCTVTGDNGALRSNAGCNISDAYISDIDDGAGGRTVNYQGTLADAFACQSSLGVIGCGFEQPLASIRAALDNNPANAGFLRENAMLAIVIVTDEDDCSVSNTAMYDPEQNDINSPLGPLSSFRCFEFGVRCDPDDPRTPGARDNCEPRTDSQYMPDVQQFIDFVHSVKPPSDVIVASIQGDPTPVTVVLDEFNGNNPKLEPSCSSAAGEASPGVRLHAFQAGFRQRNLQSTICTENLQPVLEELGTMLGTLLP